MSWPGWESSVEGLAPVSARSDFVATGCWFEARVGYDDEPAGKGDNDELVGLSTHLETRRDGFQNGIVTGGCELRREGETSGVNRIYRLYREEGLTVRKRRARRRAVGTRAPILVEARANARWSLDFVHDQCACGRRFRVLNIVDDVTRECLAAIPDTSISGRRVARELTDLISRRGKRGMIVSDHCTEFTLNAILAWSKDHRIEWHYIAPGGMNSP